MLIKKELKIGGFWRKLELNWRKLEVFGGNLELNRRKLEGFGGNGIFNVLYDLEYF